MDLRRLRLETPGCRHRVHLNNAGASLMPAPVLQAVRGHLDLESEIGGYEAERVRSAEIREAPVTAPEQAPRWIWMTRKFPRP